MEKIFFLKNGKSDKFWSIKTEGNSFTISYGKTGTKGQNRTKKFDSEDICAKEAEKLINEKFKKGYIEKEYDNSAEKKTSPEYINVWKKLSEAKNFHSALSQYFSYLADSPGFEKVLSAVMRTAVSVSYNEKYLIVDFPGDEKMTAFSPKTNPSKKFPESFRKVLSFHSNLYLKNAMLQLGDHGLFCEDDGWFDALEDECSEILDFVNPEMIISPLSDYSDLWIYHPAKKNKQGEPVLYYLSHEGGDICDPVDCNIGSLFLKRCSESLNLNVEIPESSGSINPENWWNSLSDEWISFFEKEHGIKNRSEAVKAFSIKEIRIDEKYAMRDFSPLKHLPKLLILDCGSQNIADISFLKELESLEELALHGKETEDFSPIKNLKNLKSLDLSETKFKDMKTIKGLIRLKKLKLDRTEIEDISSIGSFKNLEKLSLSFTKVKDIRPLKELKKLRELNLLNTEVLTLDPLEKTSSLSTLNINGTRVTSLAPLYVSSSIYTLFIRNTSVSFREELLFRKNHQGEEDDFLSLDVYSDHTDIHETENFIRAVDGIDFSIEGLEETLASLANKNLIHLLKGKKEVLAVKLIKCLLKLPLTNLTDRTREELAGNIMVPMSAGLLDDLTERKIFDFFISNDVKNPQLAFNLACYYAKRMNKEKMLEYTALSLAKGHDRVPFTTDEDFSEYRNDPDFIKTISTVSGPDPETDPFGWWKSIPDNLRENFFFMDNEGEEPSVEEIREFIHSDRFEIYYTDMNSFEPLLNLKGLKRLIVQDCRAKDLEVIGTLTGLTHFECETNQYANGTKFTDISPFSNLKNLKTFIFTGHKVSDISALSGLSSLEVLKIEFNPVSSIVPLRELTNLKELFFSCDEVIDTEDLAGLEKLIYLSMHGKAISLDGLKKMKSLKYLWIKDLVPASGDKISLMPLSSLQSLEKIFLSSTPFESLEPLYSLPMLNEIFVDRKRVSEELENELKKKMSKCRIVF